MVEAVVPRKHVGLVVAAAAHPVHVDGSRVVVATVRVGLVSVVTDDVAVDVLAAVRVVHREASQRRLIADLHVEGGTPVAQRGTLDDGRLGVNAEVVGQGLLRRRGAVVGGGNRQRVLAVGQPRVLVVVEVDRTRLVVFLNPGHPPLVGVIHRLPVLRGGEGSDALAGLVRVGRGHRVDGPQRARARSDGRGRARGRGTGDHVAVSVGTALAIPALHEGVVAEEAAVLAVVDGRGSSVAVTLGDHLIEDRRRAPGPVEAQVGHGHVGLAIRASREAHETVEEGARGGVRAHPLGELAAGGDVDTNGGLTLGGDGHAVVGEGDADALAVPVSGAAGEEAARDVLRQGLSGEIVGRRRAGQVVQGDVEVPALGAITEFRLGAGGVGRAVDGRVHGRGRGRLNVHEACALLTRGVVGTGAGVRIGDGDSGAHDEVLDDVGLLARAHRGEERVVLNAFKHDSANAGDLRGRHGRAGHVLVAAAGHGGVDIATGGGHLRLEAHVRRHAPRAEIGHLVVAVCPVPRVLNGRDRDHRGEGARLAQGRRVRVRGVGQVLARLVAVAGLELVASSNVESDALLLQLLVHAREQGVGRTVHAGCAAEGQVHDVRLNDRHVVQGGEQRGVGDAAAAARDLADDDLSIGGNTRDLTTVGCGDAGNVRAVRTSR